MTPENMQALREAIYLSEDRNDSLEGAWPVIDAMLAEAEAVAERAAYTEGFHDATHHTDPKHPGKREGALARHDAEAEAVTLARAGEILESRKGERLEGHDQSKPHDLGWGIGHDMACHYGASAIRALSPDPHYVERRVLEAEYKGRESEHTANCHQCQYGNADCLFLLKIRNDGYEQLAALEPKGGK